ncbi:MAG: hypothetical protein AB200_00590 [Parcubacteria bacterium C7867-005]|nr:MAG: hypothetical protein AB200_00590 [Parcubacteria bacterium C7867-005]
MNTDKNTLTLTPKEVQEVALDRVSEITKEFVEGFRFLEDNPKSVTFFGSNQFKEDNPYYQSARTLAGRIAKELNYAVASGGGPGIMEAANRGAFEVGGTSLGVTIKLPSEQTINKYITKQVDHYYFFVRKVMLSFSAEAFVFFPGGFGTLDEFFEIMTLIQTKKIEGVPIICVGGDYWRNVENFLKETLLSRETISEPDLSLYTITDDHDEILEIIRKVPVRNSLPFQPDRGREQ